MGDLDLAVNLLGLAAVWGSLLWRVGSLEKKVDKHNHVVERLYQVEIRVEGCEDRLGELESLHPRE